VWYSNYLVYARHWKTNLIPPFIHPIALFLALGLGVGHYIDDKLYGMPYLVFVAAGILATESLLRAAFECTYASFYRMKYQHTFEAVISTPVTPHELAFGEIMWGATKSLIGCSVLFVVMLIVGVFDHVWAVLSFVIILIGGVNFAAISIAVTSRVKEFEHFMFFFAAVFPLIFISGTYFPIDRMPVAAQYVMWLLPLTHIVDTTRAMISGLGTPYLYLKLLYVFISTAFLVELAVRLLAERLID